MIPFERITKPPRVAVRCRAKAQAFELMEELRDIFPDIVNNFATGRSDLYWDIHRDSTVYTLFGVNSSLPKMLLYGAVSSKIVRESYLIVDFEDIEFPTEDIESSDVEVSLLMK